MEEPKNSVSDEEAAASEQSAPDEQSGASAETEPLARVQLDIPVSKPIKVETMDDIQQAVDRHADWIESVINPRSTIVGGRANFRGAELSGYNLAGVDLRGANFSGCTLRGTVLSGANLNGANFSGAVLTGADLRGAKLRRANLDGTDLRGADWDGADFTGAQLQGIEIDSGCEAPAGAKVKKSLAPLEGDLPAEPVKEGQDLQGSEEASEELSTSPTPQDQAPSTQE